jgi:hypothetical protein
MGTKYSVDVQNESEFKPPFFHIYAILPDFPQIDDGGASLAWLTKRIDQRNQYTFEWELDYGFVWSAQGIEADVIWSAHETIPYQADPARENLCMMYFNYDGDFTLGYKNHTPAEKIDKLWIEDSPNIPIPSKQPSSVGVSIHGKPAAAIQAGPNLTHIFTLHPTYYIDCSSFHAGVMIDVATVTTYYKLSFKGTQKLGVKFTIDNTWEPI